jgi:hypothetical protein
MHIFIALCLVTVGTALMNGRILKYTGTFLFFSTGIAALTMSYPQTGALCIAQICVMYYNSGKVVRMMQPKQLNQVDKDYMRMIMETQTQMNQTWVTDGFRRIDD